MPRHYSRHWVPSSKQQRELAQTSNLCFLDSISDSQIFLLEIFCNISSVSNIVLAFNLQSDYVKDFRQNIPLLKTMKKSQMKSKEFHPFLMPGGQWDWFSFLSQLIGLTSYFVVKTTLWIPGEEKWAKSKAPPVPLPCMSKIIILCLTESDYLSWHTGAEEKPNYVMCKHCDHPLSVCDTGLLYCCHSIGLDESHTQHWWDDIKQSSILKPIVIIFYLRQWVWNIRWPFLKIYKKLEIDSWTQAHSWWSYSFTQYYWKHISVII